jgi:hypothetical protein
MSETVFALPVSVEQIAAVIKQMSQEDQQRLLTLVPTLHQIAAQQPSRTLEEAQAAVEQLRTEVFKVLHHQPLSPDELFWGNLTLAQYHALSDQEKAKLWDRWADMDIMKLDEREVDPNAMSSG